MPVHTPAKKAAAKKKLAAAKPKSVAKEKAKAKSKPKTKAKVAVASGLTNGIPNRRPKPKRTKTS